MRREGFGIGEARVPGPNFIFTGFQPPEVHRSLLARGAMVGGIGHVHVGEHPVMDVAAEHYDPRLVEDHRGRRGACIEGELELLGGRERVDMVAGIVLVGEEHRRGGLDHLDEGDVLPVDLVDRLRAELSGGLEFARERHRHDDRIFEGRVLLIGDGYLDAGPRKRRRAKEEDAQRADDEDSKFHAA